MSVTDVQFAGIVERETGGSAAVVLGCLPAAEEAAIAGEDLNLGRHIDDVQQIVLVDRNGPRPKEPAGRATG
jgi:hypothetical protein